MKRRQNENEKIKITIIGMGALGILYGDLFVKALGKEAVTFLADEERIARYRRLGVTCNGEPCTFQMSGRAQESDLVIFAVKGPDLDGALELAGEAVGEETIILSLLNGISSEEILEQRMKKGCVIHCIAQGMDAVKLGNALTYSHKGELRIGTPDAGKKPCLQRAGEILKAAGIPFVTEEDILHRLSDLAGTGVTREDLEAYVELVDSLNPDGMPSMRQDGIARRYSEVEFFSGTVLRKADEYGMEAPVNRQLYDRIKVIEAGYDERLIT